MSKIKILPEILSNKIAAGEVVERPAAVVKELVENALDAGAARILIDIGQGGSSLIQVADDGCGMSHDDALLSIERYATSKIHREDDLFAIRTLGFRGEALPSIAAVSRFTLVTRDQNSEAGLKIQVEGGRIKDVKEVGAPLGTLICVQQLFYNTPARRKFLKTVTTEMGHILESTACMALGKPKIHFRLTHNDRVVQEWPVCAHHRDRMVEILGLESAERLQEVKWEGEDLALHGWIAPPQTCRRTSRGIYLFVNGRAVRDRMLQHALLSGYQGRLMSGSFPVAVLFVTVPCDQVDVNVHPAKHEVRFARHQSIHAQVASAIALTLDRGARPPRQNLPEPVLDPQDRPAIAESTAMFDAPDRAFPPPAPVAPDTGKNVQAPLWQESGFQHLRVIGQLWDTYIICESSEGLILIDQHAAHERILFEELQNRAQTPEAQRLLLPLSIDTGHREAIILTRLIPDLKRLGLEIEPFGGRSFVVTAIPIQLPQNAIQPMITDMLEKAAETGIAPDLAGVLEECRAVMACHGAIRGHQALSLPEIKALLAQLDRCRMSASCPHGRPTWITLDKRFLEKTFRRSN